MIENIKEINLEDYTEAIPAFLTIIMMPFAYSIADGIAFGVLSYIGIKAFSGKIKEKREDCSYFSGMDEYIWLLFRVYDVYFFY